MPRVKTILKNASTNINGIQFELIDGAMVSEVIDQATADLFLSIPGFAEAEEDAQAAEQEAEQVSQTETQEDSIGDAFNVDLPDAKIIKPKPKPNPKKA